MEASGRNDERWWKRERKRGRTADFAGDDGTWRRTRWKNAVPKACERSFEGGPWQGVVTAGPTDRGGSPRRNQEFNHEWPRNQRRAVTSSEPRHPLPPGALPTTAPPLVSYINILFTSIRAAITRSLCAPRCVPKDRERLGEPGRGRERGQPARETTEKEREKSSNKNGHGVTCLALFSLLRDDRLAFEAGDRRWSKRLQSSRLVEF